MSTQKKAFGASLYFMNDQNIRDGLLPQRIKASHLIEILKGKSILVSESASKNELLDIIKTVRFDYYDYVHLSALLENPDRKESKSSVDIDEKISANIVRKAFAAVKKKLAEKSIDIDLDIGKDNKIVLNTSHVDINHSKPPMRQKTRKSGVIEIDITQTNTTVNFPATDVGLKIKEELVKEISKQLGKSLSPVEIDFEHSEPKTRTEFFTKLIESIDGYEVYDVIGVCVESTKDEDTQDVNTDFTGTVRHAVLRGKELLASSIYGSLDEKRYYIYKISWKIRKLINGTSNDSDCFTIEVEFADKVKAKGFKYQVKTVQRVSRGRLNSSTSPMDNHEQSSLAKLIYKKALSVYSEIK